MRKGLLVVCSILLLAACSSDKDEKADPAAGDATLEKETLFTQEMEENGDYDITAVRSDAEGNNVLFRVLEDIDREEDDYTYLVDEKDDVTDVFDLAEEPDADIGCTEINISANGKYLVYDCHEGDVDFTVYDLEKEEVKKQIPEEDMFGVDVESISDDPMVHAISEDDDGFSQLSVFDMENDAREDYVISDLVDDEEAELNTVISTHDGKKMLLNTYKELYLFDAETEEVEKIDDATPYDEEYDADFYIYDTMLSADGTYAYYKVSENRKDPVFTEHFFHDLDKGEEVAFEEFDYKGVRSLDENGHVLLEGEEELHLYHIGSEEARVIPEIETDRMTGNFNLSADGATLLYTNKNMLDDDTFDINLYRVRLDDVSAFDTTELLAESDKEEADVEDDGIALTENTSFKEKEAFQDLWDSSVKPMYPNDFPEEVAFKSYRFTDDQASRTYYQTTYLDVDKPTDHEIEMMAAQKGNSGQCTFEGDLEKADTIDGNDFYFHQYKNDEVEAGIEVDDFCYSFEAEDLSEDDLYKVAASLETIDEPVHPIALDDLLLPTKFPSEDPEVRVSSISSFKKDDQMSYSVGYYSEEDITLKVKISYLEPNGYESSSSSEEEVDGFEKAYFPKTTPSLLLYDGDQYYHLELSLSKDEEQAYGEEEIKEALIEIAESMKK